MPSIILSGLRNDGSGPAVNIMLVARFSRWPEPKEVVLYLGYFPHGRDYAKPRQVVWLHEGLRAMFKSDKPHQRVPDVLMYYSDVFGRRFVSRAIWKPLVRGAGPELSDYCFEFAEVAEDEYAELPGAEDSSVHVVRPMKDFQSQDIELPGK
jgi:hypothetical protein